ncbi:GlxA family transcriptional regulator [Spongiactinospora sp. TRM90649]|uniref:GlxA family transcriptional regulator n=1 Tax=Spongiactinospora sp. TRM90649 TaxID=3031114 RepID=UPI0023F87DCD|nr:GlxA family transcriptional regulator [Spongiactinospora sp. TRM90649]MDF5752638.1 GlxA family transcriptional regulator [Spongiactinospora sp. TRM90649]
MSVRRVVFVVFPGFQMLDLTGPHELFVQAGGYVIETVAAEPGPVPSSGGLAVGPVGAIGDCLGPIDTLVVVGGTGRQQARHDHKLVGWLRDAAGRSRRVASVCGGAFLLAEAGLLNGRRVVTHWEDCGTLASAYPLVAVDPDPIFIRDGHVWTSAGITAGMDLALAMVEDDLGPEVARKVARQLVMFVQRPGSQAQFSVQLAAQRPARQPLREVQAWIADNLAERLTVPRLAARAGMSERTFTRVFATEVGSTPAAYVEATRVETARRLLETTDATVERIARDCGFGTPETMYRCFRRTLGVSPGQYRDRFAERV